MKSILTSLFLFTFMFVQFADLEGFGDAHAEASPHHAMEQQHSHSETGCETHSSCHSLHHMYAEAAQCSDLSLMVASDQNALMPNLRKSTASGPPVPPPLV